MDSLQKDVEHRCISEVFRFSEISHLAACSETRCPENKLVAKCTSNVEIPDGYRSLTMETIYTYSESPYMLIAKFRNSLRGCLPLYEKSPDITEPAMVFERLEVGASLESIIGKRFISPFFFRQKTYVQYHLKS